MISSYQANPNREEKVIALATLDGIFKGCLACAKALGENPYEGGIHREGVDRKMPEGDQPQR